MPAKSCWATMKLVSIRFFLRRSKELGVILQAITSIDPEVSMIMAIASLHCEKN